MATTATKTKSTPKTATAKPAVAPKNRVVVARERVVSAAETAVDVPVGAALTAADRVNEIVVPYTTQGKREAELKRVRTQLRRELTKVERRGGTARRKTLQSAKRTRTRLERDLKQRRRSLETQVRQNRKKAETQLKKAEKQAEQARVEAEKRLREVSGRVQGLTA